MNVWSECQLGDIATLHYGKALRADCRTNGCIPVYSSAGLTGSHDEHLVNSKGLIVGRKGTVGKVYLSSQPFWCIDTAYYILPDDTKYDFKYLYFMLQTLGLEALNEDSAVPGLNRDTAYQQQLFLPPLIEQKAIGAVLSSLDDKIDLLHRQNKIFETMAATLFRQWFVEEAREDWEEVTLGDIAFNVRSSVKTADINPDIKYVGLEHIDRRNIALNQYGFGEEVGSNKSAFEVNDILFGKLRPYFHKVCFAPFSGICSTDILVMRPKRPEYFAFCLFAFFQDDVVEYANLGSGGTRMPRTDWTTLKSYRIAKPDKKIIERFNGVALPVIERITHNIGQIRTLEKLRDTLLPKLMSGEVRVEI